MRNNQIYSSLEKNTGLQILKRRLQKLRQDSDTRVNGDDGDQSLANGGNNNSTDNADWVCAQPKEEGAKSEHALDGSNNNNNVSKSALHRAHSCSSLFGLQQNIVNRHRRLSCSGQVWSFSRPFSPPTPWIIGKFQDQGLHQLILTLCWGLRT